MSMLILPIVSLSRASVYVQEHLYALLFIIILKCKSAKQRSLKKMIQNWINKRRLTEQLAEAGCSEDAIREILYIYRAGQNDAPKS
jgi:hypothetical protein